MLIVGSYEKAGVTDKKGAHKLVCGLNLQMANSLSPFLVVRL
jgi:hypothetical protein